MADLPPWMKGAKVIAPASPDARPVVEFATPVAPMSPAEQARLGLAFKADARAAAAQEGRVAPAGYRFTADGSTLEPVPGGPADPNAKVRPLREGDAQKLVDDVTQVDALKRALNSFQDDYAGNIAGDIENVAQGVTGIGTPGQRDWWADFRATDNVIRNALFGASLTAGEKSAYQSTTVTPRMSPEEVKRNLARRLQIVETATNRRVNRLRAGGYNEGEIDAIAGPVLEQPVETPQDTGPIVTAPGTTRAAAMGAVTPGEPVMTSEDMAAGRAIQEAWNATGKFEDVARVAAQFGRSFGEQEAAFLKANEGKPVNINANATGTPTATQEAVGEFVSTPGGEMVAAGAVGAGNAATLGMLDELAPILGLDAQRVQMAKDYLRNKAPVSSFAGEMVGALPAMAAMSSGAGALLGGTRIAGAAPMIGDVAFGSALAGGEAPEGDRALAALTGGAVAGAAGGAGRRLFGGAGGAGGTGDGGVTPPSGPTGSMGGRASGGAAATPDDVIRVTRAQELPVPVQLANFQKTRDHVQQQRARELAKNNEVGGPIRQLFVEQQRALASNFDSFLESTGSQIWNDLESKGVRVTHALEKMAANDKARVRTLYKQAEKSADAETPVPLSDAVEVTIDGEPIQTTIVEFLNDQPKGVPSSGVTDAARQIALRLGIVSQNEAGDLVAKQPTVAAMEKFRREITGLADPAKPTTGRQESILKQLTDAHTEPHATGAYAKARAARREVALKYQDVSTIAQLLGTKKNTAERIVAAENVAKKLIGDETSAANLRALKSLLTGEGGDPQAWREVQGGAIEQIRKAAYPDGAVKDEAGQITISVGGLRRMVNRLDEKGKLDIVFDFETAKGLRTIADVAEDVFSPPPGTVTPSGESGALQNALDMLINFSVAGIPIPGGMVNNVLKPIKNRVATRDKRKEVKQLIGEQAQ